MIGNEGGDQFVEDAEAEQIAHNEAVLAGDDRFIRIFIRIREARAALAKEYEANDKVLKDQLHICSMELLRRLNERGAEQTKTADGTAFKGEQMSVTIADPAVFGNFVLETRDLEFFVKRVKVEHMREYMAAHGGRLPPGLSVFREVTINVRAPSKPKSNASNEPQSFEEPNSP